MNRILTALTAIILALTMTAVPHVWACVSCSYTPEVVNTPVKSAPPKRASKPVVRERAQAAPKRSQGIDRQARRERPAPSRSKPRDEPRENKVAKRSEQSPAAPKDEAAAPNESADNAEPNITAVEPGKPVEPPNPSADASSSTASRALNQTDVARASRNDAPEPPKECKKYIPNAGVTITVRCDPEDKKL